MRLSLRQQILLWYAIGLPILMLAVVVVAQQVMASSLSNALDERLRNNTGVVAASVLASPPQTAEEGAALIETLAARQFLPALLRVADPEHNVLGTLGEVPAAMIPILDRQLRLPEVAGGRFENIRAGGEEAVRVCTVSVHDPKTSVVVALVQVGDSLAPVLAAQGQLWQYTLAVGMGGSLAAIVVGFFIVRRGLRPLESIMTGVRKISSGNLKAAFPEEKRPPELQHLVDTINDVMERLDRAFKTREVFIASVSHDLKTPLTVLKGQIDVLQMQPAADPETARSLQTMAREVGVLARMSNNLLLNAQLESAPAFVPRAVDLEELMGEVMAESRLLAEGLDLTLEAPEPLTVPGDYDLLKQMLLNVVDNSIKFTPRGGSIRMTLGQEGEEAVISVSDTGRGIPADHLSRITEPFYKVDGTRRFGAGGVGLGLAIVKQVVGLHGGSLDITSQKGAGTTVTMRLPLHRHPR